MFCPKCGKPDQVAESYCRQCGLFLPDISRLIKPETPPEDHLKANTVLSSMTIVTSLTLSILLFSFLGGSSNTHPLIYVTAGLLLGIGAWHIQTLIRTQLLKKQWKRRAPITDAPPQPPLKSVPTARLLAQRESVETIPASMTEHTTRQLVEK